MVLGIKTRLILFSNSEPPRLRDVVSHLITIETTINTHTRTHTPHTHVFINNSLSSASQPHHAAGAFNSTASTRQYGRPSA